MEPKEISEGKFIIVSEEVVGMKRMRCPTGSETGKNFPLDELSTRLYTERGKDNMLATDRTTERRTSSRKDA